MLEVPAFIFARGGSKGVPRKNVRPFNGTPMIGLAIKCALASKRISRVVVSTDDDEIAEVARAFGAEVPFTRPAELASDTATETDAWKHAFRYMRDTGCVFEHCISVPTTAPLRVPADLDTCLATLELPNTDLVITVSPASRSPYFNMVSPHADGTVGVVMRDLGLIRNRQHAPPVFDMTTLGYAMRVDWALNMRNLWDGKVRAVVIPSVRAIDIDTESDIRIAEFCQREGLHLEGGAAYALGC